MTHPGPKRNMVPKAVLTRSGLISLTTARPVNTAQPRTIVNSARPMTNVFNKAHSTQDLEEKGVIDSGCSRHMTGNMSYLTDFEEIDGGYVAFRDDYYRFGWVFFLATKDETSGILKSFITRVENLIDQSVKVIRCDNGTEFKNKDMNQHCERKGIKREFSVTRTPQQKGVAERKNRTLIEATRTMLADSKLSITFWAEVINTASYVQNRVLVTKPHNKTPYEFFLARKLALGFMKPFGCPVTILNTIDHLGKFDGKADEGFFVGYSINSKAFRLFNNRTRIVEENLHVQFSENMPNIAGSGPNWLFDIDALTKSMNYKPTVARNQSNGNAGTKVCDDACKARMETVPSKDYILLPLWTANPPFSQNSKSSPDDGFKPSSDEGKKVDEDPNSEGNDQEKEDNVNITNNVNVANTNEVNTGGAKTSIGLPIDPDMPELEDIVYSDNDEDVSAEADINNLDASILVSPISTTRVHKHHPVEQIIGDLNSAPQTRRITKNLEEHEPKKVIHTLKDLRWIEAMQKELLQFKLQEVWTLVDLPNGKRVIGTKWVFRNKKNKRGIVIKNKVRLVAQGYTQKERIDYDDVFAPVARIEAIRLFLAYASFKDFMVYQMDVKSAFLYGKIEKEVYVCQPPGFEDPDFPDRVYKVEKALDGLHQAPRAWYDTLLTYLLDNGFQRGKIDKTLFIKREKGDILLVQVYVDDIIFGSTKKSLCTEFEKIIHKKFQMSSMGELTFFLRLQVKQKERCINLLLLLKVNVARHKLTTAAKLMVLGINLLLPMKVNAARHKLTTAEPNTMADLKFADTHNLVAFLSKPAECEGFEQIVDFVNANPIKYALTVNPTIYTSCIEQFWATTKAKTINGEVQLQALVDRKKLTLMGYEKLTQKLTFYKEFFSPQWKFLIHTILQCLSAKTTASNEFSSTMASAIICLATNQKFNFSKYIFESMVRNVENVSEFLLWRLQRPHKLKIASLKRRVKKLEKKDRKRTHKLKRLYKVGLSTRVVSSEDEGLGGQEDASKQGRKIHDIDADKDITLENVHDADMFGVHDLDGEEVFVESEEHVVHAATTTSTIVSAAIITEVDITLAQVLAALKSVKPKVSTAATITTAATIITPASTRPREKRIVINDQEPTPTPTPIVSSPQSSQVKIETNYELAQRLQAKEQEELTIKEKAKPFQQLLEKRRKYFVAKREEEKRNRPPTKAQQRSLMSTYLKHKARWKPKDLKSKSFTNIQELFDKAMKKVNTFVDMDTKLMEGSEVRVEGSETIAQESSLKRVGDELEQEKAKKQKIDDDQEEAEMKELMEIIPDEEEVVVDAIPLATKPPSIMLREFDREDLETLWKLVKAKHGYTRPEEGYERVLWGDLKTTFQDMHIFMLVEKRYPFTPATITDMLNHKLQVDHWNEMCYQLLNLITKQLKNQ
ncbi:putative ribonuclease H-like domain-containing protein [Tanacetum coccineum]